MESYCQFDVSVLQEAFRVFSCEFIEIGNIDVFLEHVTLASACNKGMRKRFLKPNRLTLFFRAGTQATSITATKLLCG